MFKVVVFFRKRITRKPDFAIYHMLFFRISDDTFTQSYDHFKIL